MEPQPKKKKQSQPKPRIETLLATASELEEMVLNTEKLPADPETGVGMKKLTYKQLLFVMHYLRVSDIRKAAVLAGYGDPHMGYRLLDEPHVQQELERRMFALQAASAISKDAIQAEILLILQDCKAEKTADRHVMLKCLDMIAKMNGFYQPDAQINIQNNLSSIKVEIVKKPIEDGSQQ